VTAAACCSQLRAVCTPRPWQMPGSGFILTGPVPVYHAQWYALIYMSAEM